MLADSLGNQVTLDGGNTGDVTLAASASGISNFTVANSNNLNLNIGEVLSTLKMPRESRARGARL